jgi:hypothetical protein
MKKKFIKNWENFVESSSEFLAENLNKVSKIKIIVYFVVLPKYFSCFDSLEPH